jgi:ppGpp synthetase/RelA/SpoT-type nucleotidyltranferase
MTIDTAWLDMQIGKFKEGQCQYEEYGRVLEPILRYAARRYCPHAIVQVRVKTVQSFAHKALRKRAKHLDPVSQFTDLCGGRVITRLQAETDLIRRFLCDHFAIDEANSEDTFVRLNPREFGYRSIHYIVQLRKPHNLPAGAVPKSIPDHLYALRAEVQVRTLLQHAFAEVDHERTYRSAFKVPDHLVRELARLAAAMELADEAFSRFTTALDEYKADYGGHVDREAVRQELDILRVLWKHAPDERLAHQIVRLHTSLQEWDAVIALGKELRDPGHAGLLCCIGHALCQRHPDPGSAENEQGRQYLRKAIEKDPQRTEAYLRLAETFLRDGKPRKVLDSYSRAFDADPTDPQALCGYVRYKIATEQNLLFLPLLKPAILAAIAKCRAQAKAGVNLPWAHYHIGELTALLGPGQEMASLGAFLQAAASSTAEHMLEQALDGLDQVEAVEHPPPAVAMGRRLLALVLAARYVRQGKNGARRLQDLPLKEPLKPDGPVVIVAGGCDPACQTQMEGYWGLLRAAFERFRAWVISGGTHEGICGLVGRLGKEYPERITTVGYLPEALPADGTATRDGDYRILRTTIGTKGFSAWEPLQCWIDLLAAGVDPRQVRVLGINGGDIAAFEYRLGLLLGAQVGLVRDSGRKADVLTSEAEAEPIPGLALLPPDPMTLEAFLTVTATSTLSDEDRLLLAQRIHDDFCAKHRPPPSETDPACKPWAELDQAHKDANLQQADDFQRKLAAIRKQAVHVGKQKARCQELSPDEIKFLAEMEHGRYVAQKLLAGWTLGPRDDQKRQRPTLVAWTCLPEDERQKDREAVLNLPRFLQDLGFEIQPLPKTGGP